MSECDSPCEPTGKVADGDITEEELSRAKNMLRSDVMMNLEHRSVIVEDTARQASV